MHKRRHLQSSTNFIQRPAEHFSILESLTEIMREWVSTKNAPRVTFLDYPENPIWQGADERHSERRERTPRHPPHQKKKKIAIGIPWDLQKIFKGFNNLVKIKRAHENCKLKMSSLSTGIRIPEERQKLLMLWKNIHVVVSGLQIKRKHKMVLLGKYT